MLPRGWDCSADIGNTDDTAAVVLDAALKQSLSRFAKLVQSAIVLIAFLPECDEGLDEPSLLTGTKIDDLQNG